MALLKNNKCSKPALRGGFDAWGRRLTFLLAPTDSNTTCAYISGLTSTGKAHAAAAVAMTTSLVCPHLLQRLPFAHRDNLFRLMESLEARAQPFRFLDLPREPRNRIYAYVLPHGNIIGVDLGQECRLRPLHRRTVRDSSAITQVSRQLRKESLGLYYSHSHFILRTCSKYCDDPDCERIEQLRAWASAMPSEQAKNLSRVTLNGDMHKQLRIGHFSRIKGSVTFCYTPDAGIRISVQHRLGKASQAKLQKHAQRVEKDRKLVDLKGEAIILSLISDDDLWRYGGLVVV